MSPNSRNFIFIIDSLKKGGGAESSVFNTASLIADQYPHIVALFTLSKIDPSFSVHNPHSQSKLFLHEFSSPLSLALHILYNYRAFNTTVISALTRSSILSGALSLLGFRHIVSFRSDVARDYASRPFLWFLSCLLSSLAFKTIFLTHRARVSFLLRSKRNFPFLPILPSKVHCIYNSIPSPQVQALPSTLARNIDALRAYINNDSQISLCIVSRLIPSKGILQFLESHVTFFLHSNVLLNIYGDGPLFPVIQTFIRDNDLSRKIFLHGHLDCIQDHLQKNHLFLFPSQHEGFGKAPLEALFSGMPVICNLSVNTLSEISSDLVPDCWHPYDFTSHINPERRLVASISAITHSNPLTCSSRISLLIDYFSPHRIAESLFGVITS